MISFRQLPTRGKDEAKDYLRVFIRVLKTSILMPRMSDYKYMIYSPFGTLLPVLLFCCMLGLFRLHKYQNQIICDSG